MRSEDGRDLDNLVGVSPQATSGFDALYDAEEPPPAVGASPRLYIEGQAESGVGALAVDLRGVTDGPLYRWPVRPRGAPGRRVPYRVVGNGVAPARKPSGLDRRGHGGMDRSFLGSKPQYPLERAGCPSVYPEVLTAESLQMSGLLVYPNPTDLKTPVSIRFTLSGSATVRAGVYDTAGRRIAHPNGRGRSGGCHTHLGRASSRRRPSRQWPVLCRHLPRQRWEKPASRRSPRRVEVTCSDRWMSEMRATCEGDEP